MAINEGKLNELLGKMVIELGAAFVGASVIIGDQLGLYKALAALPRRNWPNALTLLNAISGSGWQDRPFNLILEARP